MYVSPFQALEKYFIFLLGLEKSLKFTTLSNFFFV